MAQTDTLTEGQPGKDPSDKEVDADNPGDVGGDNHVQIKTRTLIANIDGVEIISDDDEEEEESNVDISERLDEFSHANSKVNGTAAMSGAKRGQRPTFVHSYSLSTSSWSSWASRVAATTNINLVMRNISLLHATCSLLLIFMGILGVATKSYMSYLVIPIWSPVFFFIPTSFTGLLVYKRLLNLSLLRRLFILSTLSTLLSFVLFIIFAFFIFRDGQLNSDCQPSPAILSSECRLSVYRVLINAVIVFLLVIETIASISSLSVCCIIRHGSTKRSSDTEQLITRTSMSYKRLAAADEKTMDYFEDRAEDPAIVNNNSAAGGMHSRSVSAPALVSYSVVQSYHD